MHDLLKIGTLKLRYYELSYSLQCVCKWCLTVSEEGINWAHCVIYLTLTLWPTLHLVLKVTHFFLLLFYTMVVVSNCLL